MAKASIKHQAAPSQATAFDRLDTTAAQPDDESIIAAEVLAMNISDNPKDDDPSKRQMQGELFFCDSVTWPVKDDIASMDVPIFSLSKTKKDLEKRTWTSGNRSLTIIPSVEGAATIFDKDLLVFIGSQMVAAFNRGETPSRTVKVETSKFLRATRRGDGVINYEGIIGMLRRLKGTNLETNIETAGKRQTKAFGLIETFETISSFEKSDVQRTIKKKINGKDTKVVKTVNVERVFEFSVTVSEWFYNSLKSLHVLTLKHEYFELTSPVERKLYEIAKRHMGDGKPIWHLNLDLLGSKMGVRGERWKVREDVKAASDNDRLPEFHIALDRSATPPNVVFYIRDTKRVSLKIIENKEPYTLAWWNNLVKPGQK